MRQGRNSDEGSRDPDLDLGEMWHILWSQRIWIVGITLAFALLAVAFALIATPQYRAEVVISEVKDGGAGGAASLSGQLGGLANLVGVNLGALDGSNRVAIAALRSRILIEEFIRRNDLLPVILPQAGEGPPPTLWRGVNTFQENVLKIQQDPRTGLVIVAVTWTDPETAARWANDIVALANETVRARALQNAERNITYLKKQIEQTPVVELQRVMYNLVESETKMLMLANVREEYAFVIVDPAVAPEQRISPKRTLIVVLGTLIGGFLALMFAFVRANIGNLRKHQRLPG